MHSRTRPTLVVALAAVATLVASPALAGEASETADSPSTTHDLAVSPDGTTGYVTEGTNAVAIVDLASGSATAEVTLDSDVTSVALNPEGTQAWVTTSAEADASITASATTEPGIEVIDTATNTVTGKVNGIGAASSIAFSLDGHFAFATSGDYHGAVSVIDTDTYSSTTFDGFEYPYDVVASADASVLWVSELHSGKVKKVDARSGTVLASLGFGANVNVRGLALSADGSSLFVACPERNSVEVIDTESGDTIASIPAGEKPTDLQSNADGTSIVASATADGTVTAIDTSRLKASATLNLSIEASFSAFFNCDGHLSYLDQGKNWPVVIDVPNFGKPGHGSHDHHTPGKPGKDKPGHDWWGGWQHDHPKGDCSKGHGGWPSWPSWPEWPGCNCDDSDTTPTPEPTPSEVPTDETSEEPSPEPTPVVTPPAPAPVPGPAAPSPEPSPTGSEEPISETAEPSPAPVPEVSEEPTPTPTGGELDEGEVAPTPSTSAVPAADDGASIPSGDSDELAQTGASPSLAIAATIAAVFLGAGLLITRRRMTAK